MKKRRTKLELYVDILKALQEVTRITYIIWKVGTNNTIVREALAFFIEKEMVKKVNDKRYVITNKGLQFIIDYEDFVNKWEIPLS